MRVGGAHMIRLVIQTNERRGDHVRLRPDQVHYLRHVMRRAPGDPILLVTDRGFYRTEVDEGEWIRLGTPEESDALPSVRITLAQSLLKGDQFGEVLDLGTEAGVAAFQPLITDRSISRDVSPAKWKRWQRIVEESTEQTGRPSVPLLHKPVTLDQFVAPAGLVIVLMPGAPPLPEVYRDAGMPEEITLVTGPEGGLTSGDLEVLHARCPLLGQAGLGAYIIRARYAGSLAAFCLAVSASAGPAS